MKIHVGIGTDHRGFEFKEVIKLEIEFGDYDIVWHDFGTFTADRTDYPPFAQHAVQGILKKEIQCAVLLCGSGIGMAIAANRYPGIYAGVAWDIGVAGKAKEDDNINVLCIPADYVTLEQTRDMIQAWLTAQFKGGRYAKRLEMIDSK